MSCPECAVFRKLSYNGNKRKVLPTLEKKLSPDRFKDREKDGVNLCERTQHEILDTLVI